MSAEADKFLRLDVMEWGSVAPAARGSSVWTTGGYSASRSTRELNWIVQVLVNMFPLPKSFLDLIAANQKYLKFLQHYSTAHGGLPRVRGPRLTRAG